MRGKEGVSLGTCRARTSQASRMRVAYASQLYNYILRFYLTIKFIVKVIYIAIGFIKIQIGRAHV